MSNLRLALCAFGVALTAASPAFAGDGTNLTSLVAEDTQIMMVFDVADARDSTLLQKGFDKLVALNPDARTKMAEVGIDPLEDVDTIAFAGGGVKDLDGMDNARSMVVIIEGRLPRDKVATAPGVKASRYQGVTVWAKDDTETAFIGDRLFFTKKGKMKAVIDVALGKGKGKGKNVAASKKAAKIRAAIAATDTTADLWVAVLVPEKNQKDMAKDGMSVVSVSIGANFTADLGIGLRLDASSEDAARKMVGLIQGQLGQLTAALGQLGLTKAAKSLAVSADKAAVKASVTITGAEIDTLVKMAGAFGGGGGTP